MQLNDVYSLRTEPEEFIHIQERLAGQIDVSRPLRLDDLRTVAGVDLAYAGEEEGETGFCHIAVFDAATMQVVERAEAVGKIDVPYIPGFLTFRELPLIVEAARKLETVPDLFLFDGNGILHPRRMGIAAHSSFFLGRPTIGVAKTYFKVRETEYVEPEREKGSWTDIIVDGEALGRAVRTSAGVKPVFVSPGNGIDLDSATEVALSLTGSESRLPIPVREADMATRRMRRRWEEEQKSCP
ncbi:endonuclease V [Edaphobacillus lindanitolerans]|uniref:Endonuclease V n=1 Tax=Edaphobacillus lindanitolerans TaxID=550447 RepID=A0A1U7PKW3_9BACI|nr:endonuclease V [Edaphobacillus lindanitolerans]SIT73040.1 Endonuclease V [Edaphobacillus lindanitolerans]